MGTRNKNGILTVILGLFTIAVSHAANDNEVPRSVLFLGRLHPLILHLPIGALILTFFLDIVGRLRKNYQRSIITSALGFSAFFSILAVIMGYFLSLEGGYEESVMNIHFWTGILSMILICLLFWLSYKNTEYTNRFVFPLFVFSLLSISVAGHFGSILTHGEDFVTEYARPPVKERTIVVVDSLRIYDDVVAKILDDKCLRCHNNTKKKGDLSLVDEESIFIGGENGKVVEANNALKSDLYLHPLLPISDDKHMPPEGKPQLSKDELYIIKYWINTNLNFKDQMASMPRNDTLDKKLSKYLVFNKEFVEEASLRDITKVEDAGFSVRRSVPESAELSVKFIGNEISERSIKKLSTLKDQIVELNLSNSELRDDMTSTLSKLKKLEVLRLDNTNISDKTLRNLEGLEKLKVLNLYNTDISNSGIEALLASIEMEQLYIWKTNVDASNSAMLQEKYDVNIHNGLISGFVEITELKKPNFGSEQSLFTEQVDVVVTSQFRDVDLHYTTDNSDPDSTSSIYDGPLKLSESTKIKVRAYKDGWLPSEILERDFSKIKYKISNYNLEKGPEKRYPGAHKLFDLEEGSISFKDGKWTGYLGHDINATIDLGEKKEVNNVSVNCLESIQQWIMFPTKLIAYASKTEDGEFKKLGEMKISYDKNSRENKVKRFTLSIPPTEAQFFKIVVQSPKVLPSWHEGAGNEAWIFADEIFLW